MKKLFVLISICIISLSCNSNVEIDMETEFNKTENFKHKLILKENNNFVNFHSIFKFYLLIIYTLTTFYYLRKND